MKIVDKQHACSFVVEDWVSDLAVYEERIRASTIRDKSGLLHRGRPVAEETLVKEESRITKNYK